MTSRNVLFDKIEFEKLRVACEKGYPKEVCGLLFGRTQNGSHDPRKDQSVIQVEFLENILNGRHDQRLEELIRAGAVTIEKERTQRKGAFEFVIDPQEHYQKISRASSEGLDQIGLFHSHPDHPAVPSATDASQPFLVGWSNIIVAVHQGHFKEARSWYRESEDLAFQEEKILVK